MRSLVTCLLVAASVVFAFIFFQAHSGAADGLFQWHSGDPAPSDSKGQGYQLNFDVAGKKGTISLRTHPSEPQDQKALKKPQKTKTQPQAAPQSGTKSQ